MTRTFSTLIFFILAKWFTSVSQIVAVLALQEAGAPPDSAKLQQDLEKRLIDLTKLNQPVREYQWNLKSEGRPNFGGSTIPKII